MRSYMRPAGCAEVMSFQPQNWAAVFQLLESELMHLISHRVLPAADSALCTFEVAKEALAYIPSSALRTCPPVYQMYCADVVFEVYKCQV